MELEGATPLVFLLSFIITTASSSSSSLLLLFTSSSLLLFTSLFVSTTFEREEEGAGAFSPSLVLAEKILILFGNDPDFRGATALQTVPLSFLNFRRSSSSNFSVDSIIFCAV